MLWNISLAECALCGRNDPLQESHVIPRFVSDWLKKTSATGHIRTSGKPDRRVQDVWKAKLLCFTCEQLLGQWEKTFKDRAFAPIHQDDASKISYESWMLRFAVSVSWRVLKFHQLDGRLGATSAVVQRQAALALAAWRAFILGDCANPGMFEQHVLIVNLIESATATLSPYINRYLMRSVDVDVAHGDTAAFTYAKMGRIILMGHLTELRGWKGTKLHVRSGTVGANVFELPTGLLGYLNERADNALSAVRGMSARQKNVVDATTRRDLDRFAQSEMFEAMSQDVEMFGAAALAPKKPT